MLSGLNSEQKKAVLHGKGPLLVVAGAGTGKTEVIVRRIAHLIKSGQAQPNQILALTFTDKAAREMESRLINMVGYIYDARIMTFNAYGDDVLRRYGLDMGWSNLQVLTETQRKILLRDHLDLLSLEYFAPASAPELYISELVRFFSKLKTEMITPKEYLAYAQNLKKKAAEPAEKMEADKQTELANAFATYTNLCREQGLIDFDDQVLLAGELFKKRPNLLAKERAELKFILVDEFQDTNLAQSTLLYELAGQDANIMAVGDDDQSIYRFRGAAIANILGFKDRYPNAGAVVLKRSYRSKQAILDAAYRLIQNNNPERLEYQQQLDKKLIGVGEGGKVEIRPAATLDLEADLLAKDILKRVNKGESAGDIAVLVRKNSQSKAIMTSLTRLGIAYRLAGQSVSLFQQVEIQSLLYFLQYMANPSDGTLLYHLLSGDVFRIDSEFLRQSASGARALHQGLAEYIKAQEGEDCTPTQSAIAVLSQLNRKLAERTAGELCFDFLEATGYVQKLAEESKQDPRADLKLANLNQFFKTLHEFERVAIDRSCIGYVAHLPAIRDSQSLSLGDNPQDEVQIMTIHQAKGLEFKVVYLFDVTQGNFPARDIHWGINLPDGLGTTHSSAGHVAEERRLMYVAITRAKEELIMSYATDHGGVRSHYPSCFIEEATGQKLLTADTAKPKAQDQIELFRRLPQVKLPKQFSGPKLTLTIHQIIDYLDCPEDFRWKHILGVPSPSSSSQMYGNLMHNLIQQFHTSRRHSGAVDLTDLLGILEHEWKAGLFPSMALSQTAFAQAKSTITNFYNREITAEVHPKSYEQAFQVEIPNLDVVLSGRFDAVYDSSQKGAEIRDYKTGAASVTNQDAADKKAKNSPQLLFYALAWQLLGGNLPDRLTLDFIDSGFIGTTTKTQKQIDSARQKVEIVATGIRAGKFSKPGSHQYCAHNKTWGLV